MVTKILELLNNPLLTKTFCKTINQTLENVLKEFSDDLSVQKDLFDQIVITINNQIEIEENNRKLEEDLLQLVEIERTWTDSLSEVNARTNELLNKKTELDLLSLGIFMSKEVVEA